MSPDRLAPHPIDMERGTADTPPAPRPVLANQPHLSPIAAAPRSSGWRDEECPDCGYLARVHPEGYRICLICEERAEGTTGQHGAGPVVSGDDPPPLVTAPVEREPPVDPVDAALETLAQAGDTEGIEQSLGMLQDALRGSSKLRRAAVRERAIQAIGSRVTSPARLVDAALTAGDSGGHTALPGRGIDLVEPEPWPDPVDGAELLEALSAKIRSHVVLDSHSEVAVALFSLFTHVTDAAEVAPILLINSPIQGCGKTTLLAQVSRVVARPLAASNISPAAVYRTIEDYLVTLIIDEGDSFLRDNEALRGILNSGHSRESAFVIRSTGENHEPRRFATWGAKVLAMIGMPPATIRDRSIPICMKRKSRADRVARLPGARADELSLTLRQKCIRWGADHVADLRGADPDTPENLPDRTADNWRMLIAIADLCGGAWPLRAREAAKALSASAVGDSDVQDRAVALLGDLHELLREAPGGRQFTDTLVIGLLEPDDSPWREYSHGRPLTPVQLAKLLRRFGIRPRQIRIGDTTKKGYTAGDFEDAWARYLPPQEETDSKQGKQLNPDGPETAFEERNDKVAVSDLPGARSADGSGTVSSVSGSQSGIGRHSPGDGQPPRDSRQPTEEELRRIKEMVAVPLSRAWDRED